MNYPVRFVSLGPGDAELITLKALHALQQADIIFCPSTKNNKGKILSRAASLLSELEIKEDAMRMFMLPMSKDRTKALQVYKDILSEIKDEYKQGKRIAVAVEGDAGIYASIHYVLDSLKEESITTEQLCGIPSFIAAGAVARLHLISQEEKLAVIPGSANQEELDYYLNNQYVPVIMKLSQCANVMHEYIKLHPHYAYHYFENVSTEKEYYSCNRIELADKEYPYFSLMIIINEQARLDNNPE